MIENTMSQAKLVNCLGREIFYREYGDRQAPAVVAMHGLGGQGLNFDRLATVLAQHYRVICPDMIGRGRSQWALEPDNEYCFERYSQLLNALLEHLCVSDFHWLGTSMGGALGMYCIGNGWGARINSLVLNDIGPEIDADVLAGIAEAAGSEQRFNSYRELSVHIARYLGEWAAQPDNSEHWDRFALTGARRCDNGQLALHHDTAIARQFARHASDYQNWQRFAKINCPLLIIRGNLSTVLTAETAERMQQIKPHANLVVINGWGHAPFLDTDNQIELITQFLSEIQS